MLDARWTSPTEVRVRLTGANGGLRAAGDRVLGFEATTADGRLRFVFFRAAIDATTSGIVLSTNRDKAAGPVPEAIDLWYGRAHDPVCTLTDSLDLPLPTFGPVRLPPRPPTPPRAK